MDPAGEPLGDDLQHLDGLGGHRALGPLDFVDVATPTSSHLELALWALRQGYHVLCEKPVAISTEAARRLAAAARETGRLLVPCHQYRFNPVWKEIRRRLDEGAIGEWHLAEFFVYRPAADPGIAGGEVPWRGRRAGGLGGVLLDHGTHLIYQLLDVAGLPDEVRAWTGRLAHPDYDVEDSAHLLFDYGGRAAKMFLTWAGRRRETRVRFIGECGSIEWADGTLTLETDGRRESTDWSAALNKRSYSDWYAELFLDFANAVQRGDPEPYLSDIERVAGVLESAYAAAVPVPAFGVA